MGDVTYGPESRGSPRGQRNCRILSSVTRKHPPSFSGRHIKVGLLHFHLAWTSIGIGTKVKIEIAEKSATEMQVHPKLSCISLGRGLRCAHLNVPGVDRVTVGKQHRAILEPSVRERCTSINWLDGTRGNPAEGWHQQHSHLWQMQKNEGAH